MQIDISEVIKATRREVHEVQKDGVSARVVVLYRTYKTTPDDLWDALTNIDRIPRWFLPISGDLKLGGNYQFEGNAGGEILECEKPSNFYITWVFGEQATWVKVQLTEQADGTELRLEHIAHVPDDLWKQYGPGAVGVGWDGGFLGLGNHVEKGESMTAAEGMAWLMTDEGKSFSRASSEDWYRASVAAGEPVADARAAADRTTAAYTGE